MRAHVFPYSRQMWPPPRSRPDFGPPSGDSGQEFRADPPGHQRRERTADGEGND